MALSKERCQLIMYNLIHPILIPMHVTMQIRSRTYEYHKPYGRIKMGVNMRQWDKVTSYPAIYKIHEALCECCTFVKLLTALGEGVEAT